MPFGTDYMTVTHIAEEAARRFGGTVFPPIYYGDVRYILQECRPEWRNTYRRDLRVPDPYPGLFGLEYVTRRQELTPPPDDGPVGEKALRLDVEACERFFSELIARTLLAIHLYGFRNILILPGHGPNPTYCRAAEEVYRQTVLRRKAFGTPARTMTWFYIEAGKQSEPLLRNHWIHADKWEGAVTMVAAPGTVHPKLLPPERKTLVPAYLGEPYLNETRGYNPELKHLWHSFDALDPRNHMTEDYGREQVEAVVTQFGEVVRSFVSGVKS
jgi:creatinine amidohydrolase/Fe(II)-dependent formamide hydrolase-like protein